MIYSMTAFGSGSAHNDHGSLVIECRTVNSRFLDVHLRLPDDLRFLEGQLRESLATSLKRGKLDIRVNFTRTNAAQETALDTEYFAAMAQRLEAARQFIPDIQTPDLLDLLQASASRQDPVMDHKVWTSLCDQALAQALSELQAARGREGERLAAGMRDTGAVMNDIVDSIEKELPQLLEAHQHRITEKLREALTAVSPDGLTHISGEELSARIAQEASLFSMRSDVAEELARLRAHLDELRHLLAGTNTNQSSPRQGSTGKRLDFLCQEMNREANTLGSKAAGLAVTNAAIDLKLLIEQLREQAQNIE